MSERLISKITFIHSGKKWGYILRKDLTLDRDYAFKPEDLVGISIDDLKVGMDVSFELESNGKYLNAVKIKLAESEATNEEEIDTDLNINDTSAKSVKSFLDPIAQIDNSEIIIGIVSAIGINSNRVIDPLCNRLNNMKYSTEVIRVSELMNKGSLNDSSSESERVIHYMKEGDKLRKQSGNHAILAAGAIKQINKIRKSKTNTAYIINSLKHPDEVALLRKVYGPGFYLIGIHADEDRRREYLIEDKGCLPEKANELINIDENEGFEHGQKTSDTFHLSDFFLNLGKNEDQVKKTIQRFLELIFSHPYKNPTFDEFAMYMAFNSSIRSGDLSRQVGAVLSRNEQILATGANDVPKPGGGLYWAYEDESGEVIDDHDGKDYKRIGDPNKLKQTEIIDDIVEKIQGQASIKLDEQQMFIFKQILESSRIRHLTEFGRVVHAEMEAILSCGREGISTSNATLYCTTFPCHNCAKHIIASGIKRVVYVEPYPKSLALELHNDSIELKKLDGEDMTGKVVFESFIGVGPRRFLDLFSMNLGLGSKLKRKDENGNTLSWSKEDFNIRTPLIDKSYTQLENEAIEMWNNKVK